MQAKYLIDKNKYLGRNQSHASFVSANSQEFVGSDDEEQ